MAAVAGLATALSVEPLPWPFVTLNTFQMRARNVEFLSGVHYIALNPIVTAADLPAWESYVLSPVNSWM
jgi:hypothetical protein